MTTIAVIFWPFVTSKECSSFLLVALWTGIGRTIGQLIKSWSRNIKMSLVTSTPLWVRASWAEIRTLQHNSRGGRSIFARDVRSSRYLPAITAS